MSSAHEFLPSRPLSQRISLRLAKLRSKLRRDLALFLTWLAVVLAIGLILAVSLFERASTDDLVEIELNDGGRGRLPVGLRDVLYADFGVILGYTVLLAAASLTAWFLAWTVSGKRVAAFGLAAAFVAALADAAENSLLLIALPDAGSSSVWRISAAVAATVKFCALVPAIVVAVWGIGTVFARIAQWLFVRTPYQWKKVVEPTPTQKGHQQGWRNGYGVPGVDLGKLREKADKEQHTIGVCLSGGGVRSACVALGAMQTLAKKGVEGVLHQSDYVISVSGGGYTAGAYIQSLQPPASGYGQASSASPETEPLALSDMFAEGSAELGHLRRHSSYIANSPAAMITALAVVARNLATSLLALFAPAVALGVIAGLAYSKFPITAFTPSHLADTLEGWSPHPVPVWWAIGLCAGAAALAGCVAMLTEIIGGSTSPRVRSLRRWAQKCFLASTAFALLVAAVTVVLPGVLLFSDRLTAQARPVVGGAAAIVVLNYIAALAAMGWRNKGWVGAQLSRIGSSGKPRAAARKAIPRGVVQHLLVVITLLVLLLAWLVTLGGVAADTFESFVGRGSIRGPMLASAGAGVAMLVLACSDVTSLSLHPFYRRRLACAFAIRRVKDKNGSLVAEAYPPDEPTTLPRYGRIPDGDAGPRFVFAAAATMSGADRPAPGLSTVSYTMSADHIGGPDLGWMNTNELHDAATERIKRDLTVQAAVAISGAAFASAMGRMSAGYQTLLAVSGARLGSWLPNPCFVKKSQKHAKEWTWPHGLPNIRGPYSYLLRELLGINPKAGRLVQVTDGGHYENLGLVEALRRRCTLIYCIDATGDHGPTAETLSEALRLAEFELGVKITLPDPGCPYAPEDLAPGTGKGFEPETAFGVLNARLTKGAIVTGEIEYPTASGLDNHGEHLIGQLIVAKAVLWDQCGYWLRSYAAANPVFPHDSTSDQWFDEGQFAAYTELGRLIGAAAITAGQGSEPRYEPHADSPHHFPA
ncbi:patatin-like phospholipase family protein [Nocardia sp. XZ_19_231]|uniref:patatin-like phospholipase family protein n=1 Tax=Nocardia sp. XZ_19_231 TaxID=2769252 RepID=UPI00188DF53C|nr:patatin-like phospholipase family protein [Nocardia sp. XZ_19_231]